MKARRTLATTLVATAIATTGAVGASSSASAWVPLYCQYNAAGGDLKWRPAITNTAAYSNPAEWSIKVWNQSMSPIVFTKVTSGANLKVADGNFGNYVFDGILLDSSGTHPNDDSPLRKCVNGYWTETLIAWWNRYHTDSYSGQKKQSVMVHEIGHAIGMAHRNTTGDCANTPIMEDDTLRRYDVCGKTIPQADDVKGANDLY